GVLPEQKGAGLTAHVGRSILASDASWKSRYEFGGRAQRWPAAGESLMRQLSARRQEGYIA
ncbi:MAG: hypothetical protein KAW67_07185, partial [Candidatus Eisenbacteria sp.]|nr:hypothetical protein [Candidatus Eisenbacteria bacterium]